MNENTITLLTILVPIVTLLLKQLYDYAEARKAQKAEIKEINTRLDALTSDVNAIKAESDFVKMAMIALIRDRISEAHADYAARGTITKYQLQSVESMYESYSQKVENTFTARLVQDIRGLKLIEDPNGDAK